MTAREDTFTLTFRKTGHIAIVKVIDAPDGAAAQEFASASFPGYGYSVSLGDVSRGWVQPFFLQVQGGAASPLARSETAR